MHHPLRRLCLLSLLVLSLCLPSMLRAQQVRTQRVLLVFGLNQFEPVGQFSDLSYATRDAVRMFDTLTDARLGQFNRAFVFASEPELRVLAQEPDLAPAIQCILEPARCRPGLQVERREPTAQAMREVLQMFRPQGNRKPLVPLSSGDTIVAYVATHGTVLGQTAAFRPLHPEQVAFITADTRVTHEGAARKVTGHLTEQDFMETLEATNATHRLLIEATCHTNIGVRTRGSTRTPGRENIRRTLLIADSSPGQSSIELDSLKATAFTDALIEALRAPVEYEVDPQTLRIYDPDGDGGITVEEAYEWAAEVTWQRTCAHRSETSVSPPACQIPSFQDNSYFRREPFILSGELSPTSSLASVVAATLIHDHQRGELGRARGALELDGKPLEPSRPAGPAASAGTRPGTQPLKAGLHRLREKGHGGLFMWIPSGEHFGLAHLGFRLDERRSWGLGFGTRSGWGVPGSLALEAQVLSTVLTTPRGGTRLEQGFQLGLSLGSACLSRGSSELCPLNPEALSWQAGPQAFLQVQQHLPGRFSFSVLAGASLGATYLHVYDEVAFPTGALSKIAVVGGPIGGLEWPLARQVRWRPDGGAVRVSPPTRVQLRFSLLGLKGALTADEFSSDTAWWHWQGQAQLTWLQQF